MLDKPNKYYKESMMASELDPLGPLMRAVEQYASRSLPLSSNRRAEVGRKAEQYGAYKALLGIMCEAELVIVDKKLLEEYERQYEAARKAYFDEEA